MISDILGEIKVIDFVDATSGKGASEPLNEQLIASLAKLCPGRKELFLWSLEDHRGTGNFEVYFDQEEREFVILAEYPVPDAPGHFNGITLSYSESGRLTQYFTERFQKVDGIEVEGEVPPGAVVIPGGPLLEQEKAQATGLELILNLANRGTFKGKDEAPPLDRSR